MLEYVFEALPNYSSKYGDHRANNTEANPPSIYFHKYFFFAQALCMKTKFPLHFVVLPCAFIHVPEPNSQGKVALFEHLVKNHYTIAMYGNILGSIMSLVLQDQYVAIKFLLLLATKSHQRVKL